MNIFKQKNNLGFIFLEIIIAVALISIALVLLLGVAAQAINFSSNIRIASQIDSLQREEIEALRSFRDGTTWATNGLGSVNTGSSSPYYLSLDKSSSPAKWVLVAGSETISGFTKKIVFDKVSRDPATQYIESTYNASHDDANTRKVTVSIIYSSKTYQVVTYLTNWQ